MKVLDKGFVELVDSVGNDLSIVRAARVLPDAEWRGEADIKLLRYLLKHRHTSPFEHVVFTFHVKAPIFVFRQWHRHRTWSFNELSARYKELPDEYYTPEYKMIGVQSKSNHQGRELSDNKTDVSVLGDYIQTCEDSFCTYHSLIGEGWPRELARCVLPLATYSEMIATVDLHNLMHFFSLRSDEHAQYEIKVYSDAMQELVKQVVPETMKVLND